MPLWLLIVSIVVITIGFCIFAHMLFLCFVGHTIRDNIVFKNKYQYKIYKLKEKLKKYEEKINDQISYLECKSIYSENIKILHEKNLNSSILLTNHEFIKINKKKGK